MVIGEEEEEEEGVWVYWERPLLKGEIGYEEEDEDEWTTVQVESMKEDG